MIDFIIRDRPAVLEILAQVVLRSAAVGVVADEIAAFHLHVRAVVDFRRWRRYLEAGRPVVGVEAEGLGPGAVVFVLVSLREIGVQGVFAGVAEAVVPVLREAVGLPVKRAFNACL